MTPTEFLYRGRVYSYTAAARESLPSIVEVTIEGPDGTRVWAGKEGKPAAAQVDDWMTMMDDFLGELLAQHADTVLDGSLGTPACLRGEPADLDAEFVDAQDRRAFFEELAANSPFGGDY